jgi:hypothetical protein
MQTHHTLAKGIICSESEALVSHLAQFLFHLLVQTAYPLLLGTLFGGCIFNVLFDERKAIFDHHFGLLLSLPEPQEPASQEMQRDPKAKAPRFPLHPI